MKPEEVILYQETKVDSELERFKDLFKEAATTSYGEAIDVKMECSTVTVNKIFKYMTEQGWDCQYYTTLQFFVFRVPKSKEELDTEAKIEKQSLSIFTGVVFAILIFFGFLIYSQN